MIQVLDGKDPGFRTFIGLISSQNPYYQSVQNKTSFFRVFPVDPADSQRGRGVGLGTGGAVGSTCA